MEKCIYVYTHRLLKSTFTRLMLWKKYLTWRCWTSLLVSFVGGFPRGGWSGGGPLKQFVLHVGSLDVNTRLSKQHDAVQNFQRNQPEEGEGCSLERCISEWKKCSVTLNQKLFPLLQKLVWSFNSLLFNQLCWMNKKTLKPWDSIPNLDVGPHILYMSYLLMVALICEVSNHRILECWLCSNT